ncbi:MAG: hypothetical protein ACRELY_17065 [Polyangiaceae bacterium]
MSKKALVLVAPPPLPAPASSRSALSVLPSPTPSRSPLSAPISARLSAPVSSRSAKIDFHNDETIQRPSSMAMPAHQPLKATKSGSTYVYADSTPFPYDMDFIRTIDDAVTCCVALLESETSIIEAQDQATFAEQARQEERVHLSELGSSVRDAIMHERANARTDRVVQTGTRLLAAARATVESQVALLDKETEDAVNEAKKKVAAARAEVHLAIESFLAVHDVPKTDVELSLVCSDEGAGAIVTTTASYGLQASFEVAISDHHAWRKTRRVREVCEGTVINPPKTVGIIKKRIEPRPFKLDDLFVRSFVIAPDKGKITFNKKPQKPDCAEIELDFRGETTRAFFRPIDPKTNVKGDVYELTPDDRTVVLRLWRFITAACEDLRKARKAMKRALFEGRPIVDVSPETLARRIVAVLAPIVREIARRAGARGELSLRRALGAWERHESFITCEELLSRTYDLPVHARRILDPICQPHKQRSVAPPALPPLSRVPMLSSSSSSGLDARALSSMPSIPALPPLPKGLQPAPASVPPPPRSTMRPPPLPPEARAPASMFPKSAIHTIDVPASDVSVVDISIVEVLDDLEAVG